MSDAKGAITPADPATAFSNEELAAALAALPTREETEADRRKYYKEAKSPGAKPGKRGPKIKPRIWGEIEHLYETNEATIGELSSRYGIKEITITRHFSRKGIKRGSKAAEAKEAAKKVLEKVLNEDADIMAQRIRETKDQHYQMASNLAKLVWAEILDARKAGAPVGGKYQNIKTLQTAINALKQAREERFAVLGLDRPDAGDPNEIPQLEVAELTADEVEELRRRNDRPEETEEFSLEGAGPPVPSVDDPDVTSEGDEDDPVAE